MICAICGPFERVIQVQVCLSIESALSAFDFEGGGECERVIEVEDW